MTVLQTKRVVRERIHEFDVHGNVADWKVSYIFLSNVYFVFLSFVYSYRLT